MATVPLYRRVKWIGSLSIISILLITIWFIRYSSTGNLIPISTMPPPRPEVTIRQGTILGVDQDQGYPQVLEAFLGVPYGLPTDGQGRFSPPSPVLPGVGVLDAGNYGQRCPSGPVLFDPTPEGEDCLNLNIYRTKFKELGKKMPVLVYIHGGSFNSGAGNGRRIDQLTGWSMEPMIGISFNYRLGALGFLPSKFMEEQGLLNVGLKDQALLFQWVQENLAAFGGDPDNVTIMGSSAGAHSVGHHLLYDTDRPPPFKRAILESGAATARVVYTPTNPLHENQFQEFLQLLHIPLTPSSEVLPSLRSKSFTEIMTASSTVFEKYRRPVRWPFQPVIDGPGGMIPTAPIKALKSGNFHRVPILTGFNANEGSTFVPQTVDTGEVFTSFFHTILPSLSDLDLEQLDLLYPDPVTPLKDQKYKETRKGVGFQFTRLEQAYGHFAYIAPVLQTALYASSPSSKSYGNITGIPVDPQPVYLYEFALPTDAKLLTSHASHDSFVTRSPAVLKRSKTVKEVSINMHAYWNSFILTGDPNAVKGKKDKKGRVKWPNYDGKARGGNMLVFGEGNTELIGGKEKGVAVRVGRDEGVREACEYWMERTELFEI